MLCNLTFEVVQVDTVSLTYEFNTFSRNRLIATNDETNRPALFMMPIQVVLTV